MKALAIDEAQFSMALLTAGVERSSVG